MTDRLIHPPAESVVHLGGRLVSLARGATGAVYIVDDERGTVSIDVLHGSGHGCTVHGARPTGLLRFPVADGEGPSAA